LSLGNVLRRLDARTILRVDRAGDEHGRRLVIRIKFRRSARMLFRLNKVTFAISFRSFVQLVLRSDSVDYSAPGAGSNKDRQNNSCGDPGLSEFHLSVTPISY
jgi:hypothetical protein